MKKISKIILILLLINISNIYGQDTAYPPNYIDVTLGTKADSTLVMGSDGLVKYVPRSTYFSDYATLLWATALDNANVKLTGNQSIAGQKTFTDGISFSGEISVSGDADFTGSINTNGDLSAATLTPTSITTGNIPYKSAGALLDSPISTDGTDVTIANDLTVTGDVSATGGLFSGDVSQGDFSTSSLKSFYQKTNKSIFSIITDGTANAAGTTINYSWANGGQGSLKFDNSAGTVLTLAADRSATFASIVSATDAKLGGSTSTETLGVHNSSRPYIHLTSDTTGKTGADGTFIGFVSTSGALEIRNKENQPINFKTNDIQALTLASDQSATFASSVTANTKIRIEGDKAKLEFYDISDADTASIEFNSVTNEFEFSQGVTTTNEITATTTVSGANIRTSTSYTFATLPAGPIGLIAHITDASTISYRADAAGGGSAYALVTYDGTKWIYH